MATPPAQMLERHSGQKVTLQIKDGRTLSGRLLGCDEHMNLVLEEVEETRDASTRRLGRVVLRGSNVVTVQVPGVRTAGA